MTGHTHTVSEWLAFLSLGLSLSSAAAAPVVAFANADHFAWPDWRPMAERAGDRLLVETVNARYAVRDAALSLAALLALLFPATGGTR